MSEDRSLDELPEEVFVALGRRGMEGIPLKECTYQCDSTELSLKDVTTKPSTITGSGVEEVTEEWHVQCDKCHREFTIRCKIRYAEGKRYDTMVHILDDTGKDLGWLGSY